ncbi:MAG TPA: DUF4430 domain-containing protein [Bacillota bacterium]|nr:DUF4430 domain-containing protein [Bacillota bacterium]HPF42140.1 DUF4430 domain-containing protein [Bacillota bacterium]HPJ85333.1 DUF4430 domain-containing protein [Bacillota bacterium]HPQ61371.1 DUF4430 domain-containing protein [Bacillota bacterium]HRX91395.1 DUF4430 domain-containing protein [Candidatus Izemoplasmatales bacterium]
MKRKALGIMLALILLPAFLACGNVTTSGTDTLTGTITFELYDANDGLISQKTIAYEESDTLLGLLQENYTVYCNDADGNPDDTCSYEYTFGHYIVGIGDLDAYTDDTYYISFYINGQYSMTGIDDTPITDGYCYQFKLE